MSRRFLVTGGAGFIGSHAVRALLERGDDVVVLDDCSTGKEENLTEVRDRITFIRGSILDESTLRGAIAGASHVLHYAACVSVPESMEDPGRTHAVNTTGTLALLEAARSEGVQRVVYAASCAVYGDEPTLPKTEALEPAPMSPYAVSKHVGELYGACYTETMGLEVASLRFFNVFGPRQDPSGGYAAAIPAFASRMLAGKRPTVYGDGRQTRDFIYVGNVVDACLLAAEVPEAAGETFNVGTGIETSVLDIIAAINHTLERPLEPDFAAARRGDILRSVASIAKARRLLGFQPQISLTEGLERTLAWYEES